MPTLQDLAANLTGSVPELSNAFSRKFVNKAFEEVKRAKLWTWNIGQGVIVCPQLITSAGTCTVTQWSLNVQFDATAIAVLLPQVLGHPPLTSRQFRIGAGPVYSIITYNSTTGLATLDRLYGEATVGGTSFVIYQCYYGPPSVDASNTPNYDFLRFISILNPINGYSISGRKLNMTQEELNRRDPMRGAQGQPYYASRYHPTPLAGNQTGQQVTSPVLGTMVYELWPHPTFQQNLPCQYEKLHVDLNPGDYFPLQCSIPLIQYKAEEYAFKWAAQNVGRIPALKGTDWRYLISSSQASYKENLVLAKMQDEEIMPTILWPGSEGALDFYGPADSNFWQSHAVPAM